MIGWYTGNPLSRTVMESIPEIEIKNIMEFDPERIEPSIFYGILRGCGRAMHILHTKKIDYYYIDNGYFDALYVDKNMHKSMEGKFRVVKNGMHDTYTGRSRSASPKNILVLPPSPYSANFYDTTPEDWIAETTDYLSKNNYNFLVRRKDTTMPLADHIAWCDGVMSFNSMAVMFAIEAGKSVCDTHGMFRKPGFHFYDMDELHAFYEPKQYTLQEMREGKIVW